MISVIADNDEKTAKVVVPDYQLSLAIGKEGQNARLAARLTGFKIDIKSETQARESGDFYDDPYEEDIFEEEAEEGFFEEENYNEMADEQESFAQDIMEDQEAYTEDELFHENELMEEDGFDADILEEEASLEAGPDPEEQ